MGQRDVVLGQVYPFDLLVILERIVDAKRHVLPRKEIDQMQATGRSLMPEGLESQLDPQQMADLIRFIKDWRYPDANIPGLSDR